MSLVPLRNFTIKNFGESLRAKKFTALEATQAFFSHIKETDASTPLSTDKNIGAYLSHNEEAAIKTAEAVDIALAKGDELSPLAGVPLAIKDNILIKGDPATAGSKMLEHYRASYDAGVIQKLKAQQAVFLGKTNMDEFAMGSSTENSAYKITKNPVDTERVPGGSSGGSVAAVAAHMAVAALGSDTGGSIRQPAAFCGVVGLKPTYGAVSRSGLIAMASSLDQIGPITKTVEDAAILFDAIRGKDPLDATSVAHEYGPELLNPDLEKVKTLRIGLPEEYFMDGMAPEVGLAIQEVIKTFENFGIATKKISLPHTRYALAAYYIVMPAEVSANLARFDGIRYGRISNLKSQISNLRDIYFKQRGEGFGAEVKRRIILGTFVLSSGHYDAYYAKAQQIRALIKKDFDDAFREVDVVLAPVTPTPAFRVGEKTDNPLSMYLSDVFTIPANLAGLPAISIPIRPTTNNQRLTTKLPIGFQLIGKHWAEADILGLGRCYEAVHRSA